MVVDSVILQMINKHKAYDVTSKTFVIRQVIQEVVLASLARTDFFDHAALISKHDLTFACKSELSISNYQTFIKDELNSFGIKVDFNNNILLCSYEEIVIKEEIKLIQICSACANFAHVKNYFPYTHFIKCYDDSTLLGEVIYQIINNDNYYLYDYIKLLANNAILNVNYITNRFNKPLEEIKELLINRFNEIYYDLAKKDVLQFVKDPKEVAVYSANFFINTLKDIIIK